MPLPPRILAAFSLSTPTVTLFDGKRCRFSGLPDPTPSHRENYPPHSPPHSLPHNPPHNPVHHPLRNPPRNPDHHPPRYPPRYPPHSPPRSSPYHPLHRVQDPAPGDNVALDPQTPPKPTNDNHAYRDRYRVPDAATRAKLPSIRTKIGCPQRRGQPLSWRVGRLVGQNELPADLVCTVIQHVEIHAAGEPPTFVVRSIPDARVRAWFRPAIRQRLHQLPRRVVDAK